MTEGGGSVGWTDQKREVASWKLNKGLFLHHPFCTICSSPLQQPSLFLSETEKRRPWLCCLAATLTQWFCIITLTRQFSQSHVSAAFCPLHKRSIHCLRLSHMVECSGVAPEETSSHFHAAFKFLFALKATELPPWLPFCMSRASWMAHTVY